MISTIKVNKNVNMHGNSDPSLGTRSTIIENSSLAYIKEKTFLTNLEKLKHTELGEIYSRQFKHTKLSETKITNNES